jgi:hypothetical protein
VHQDLVLIIQEIVASARAVAEVVLARVGNRRLSRLVLTRLPKPPTVVPGSRSTWEAPVARSRRDPRKSGSHFLPRKTMNATSAAPVIVNRASGQYGHS